MDLYTLYFLVIVNEPDCKIRRVCYTEFSNHRLSIFSKYAHEQAKSKEINT